MISKNHFAIIVIALFLITCSLNLFAEECSIDSNLMDRGERKAFIICGKGIPRNYTLKGLSEARITIEYEQYLKMCDIGIDTPGIYLIIKAQDDAVAASVSILHADTKEPVCENLTIAVPNRIHVGEATLENTADPVSPLKILTIKAGKSQDLRYACQDELTFPEGKWPSLSLPSQEDKAESSPSTYPIEQPDCSKSSVRALVEVQGQQRTPAKIVIPKVRLQGGEEKEGVAYAVLPPPEWISAMRDEDAKYIDVNGIRTRYFDKGKGEALLFVHGGQAGDGGNNAQSWEQNYDYLARYFHVYALDRLGQGYTDNPKPEEDYEEHYQQVADHVYGFIKAVGIEKVHLIGHSQGGWPVTRIALDHPEMVKSLVNVDGSPAPPDPLFRFAAFTMYMVACLHPAEGPTRESIRRGMQQGSYSLNNITAEKVERAYKLSQLPKMAEAEKLMTKHGVHPGSPSFLPLQAKALEEIKAGKLKVPTLLVWGYHDAIMHHEVGMELFKCIVNSDVPGSRLVIFDNCNHFPHLEYPELFNRTIKSFCGAYSSKPID